MPVPDMEIRCGIFSGKVIIVEAGKISARMKGYWRYTPILKGNLASTDFVNHA
jgi:hypothetical protein